jgi:hypothetical protein
MAVRIGRTLQSFPPSKQRRRFATPAAFQQDALRPLACAGPLLTPCGRLSRTGSPGDTSPRFGGAQSVRSPTPGGPAPCPRHDRPAFGSAAAAVLPPAHWQCRVLPRRGHGMGVPQCPRQRRAQPVAASATPGGWGTTPAHVRPCQARRPARVALGGLNHRAPRPRHDASSSGSLRPPRVQDSGGPSPGAGQPPPCSSQASDPRGCQPLTPAA